MMINTLKIFNNKISTIFNGNKIPEDNECCTRLSEISLDSIVNVDKKILSTDIFRRMQICCKKEKKIILLMDSIDGFNNVWLKHSIHYVFWIELLKNALTEIKA